MIAAVLPMLQKPPIINSITLEPERMNNILPLVKEHSTKVIGLCQSEDEMAETAEAKLAMAEKLVEAVTKQGIPLDDLYIDPLVYPLSTNTEAAGATLKAIELIMNKFPGVHTTMGLTNVSHGLPMRKLVNRSFLVASVTHGLDSAIMDPTDKQLYGALKAALMVIGKDDFCMEFITAHREGRLG